LNPIAPGDGGGRRTSGPSINDLQSPRAVNRDGLTSLRQPTTACRNGTNGCSIVPRHADDFIERLRFRKKPSREDDVDKDELFFLRLGPRNAQTLAQLQRPGMDLKGPRRDGAMGSNRPST